jgi:hypothetical protein
MLVKVIVSNRPTNDITHFGLCKNIIEGVIMPFKAVSNSLTKFEKSLNSELLSHVFKKMSETCY